MSGWTKVDAWHRRDVGNGSYLIVTRTRPDRDWWHWFHRITSTGEVIGFGPHGVRKSYPSALTAMGCADRSVTPSEAVVPELKKAA